MKDLIDNGSLKQLDENNTNYEEKDKLYIEHINKYLEGVNTEYSLTDTLEYFLKLYSSSPRYINYMNEHEIEEDPSFKKLFWIIENMEILQEFMNEHMKQINKFLYGSGRP